VAQAKRRRDFAKTQRLAGTREMRYDLSFSDRRAGLRRARHGNGHCMRSSGKTRRPEQSVLVEIRERQAIFRRSRWSFL
jgi:hypothetical protein